MKNKAWFPWNGSKLWLLDRLTPLLASYTGNGRYYEPFVGCGIVSETMKRLNPSIAQNINDINPWLTSAFKNQLNSGSYQLPPEIYNVELWRSYKDCECAELGTFLATVRFAVCLYSAWGNRWKSKPDGSMGNENPVNPKFCEAIYLNKKLTAFLNRKWLSHTDVVSNKNWLPALQNVQQGDLIYLDPPYPESLGYGNSLWTFSDQLDIVDFAAEAHKKGIKLIISNMSTVERLYARAGLKTFTVTSNIKSKTRRVREEVIAHNLF